MKLRAERAEFGDAVGWVRRALPSRATRPVLSCIRLEVTGDRALLTGSNDDWSAELNVPVQGARDGAVLVPGKLLDGVVRHLPAAPVELEAEADVLHVRCGSAKFALRLWPLEDFPVLAGAPEDAPAATVKAEEFARAVAQVARAASTDEARPAWTRGVLLEARDGSLTATATDSYRLALRTLAWDQGPELTALVPRRPLEEAQFAAEQLGSDVRVLLESAHATFMFGDRSLRTTLLQERFPDYRTLIPSGHERVLEVERAELVEVVKRVSVVGDTGATGTTPVTLHLSADGVRVTAGSGEVGQAEESLPARLEGEDLQIAFNPRYLVEGLEAAGGEAVVLQFRDELKPAVIRTAPVRDDAAEGDFLYLLMPVRV